MPYHLTEKGDAIAQDAGLPELGEAIVHEGSPEHLYEKLAAVAFEYSVLFDYQQQDEILAHIRNSALDAAKTDDEVLGVSAGLSVEPGKSQWRYANGPDFTKLFPTDMLVPYRNAIELDPMVVSGAIGHEVAKSYRNRYPILARNGFEQYGFDDYFQACAFAGAYVVGRFIDSETPHKRSPGGYSYRNGPKTTEVRVGGDMHGDFRLEAYEKLTSDVISPTGKSTEYAPGKQIIVAGYDSIETNIAAGLLLDVYLRYGLPATVELIRDFEAILKEEALKQADADSPSINFADYGSKYSSSAENIISLGLACTDDQYLSDRQQSTRLSRLLVRPQSSASLDINRTNEGLVFVNDYGDGESREGIEVPESHYEDFFWALVLQANNALGRTSPANHAHMLVQARKALASKPEAQPIT